MSGGLGVLQAVARWLVRSEVIVLSVIYLYFVISDSVPLVALMVVGLVWLARWWTTGTLLRSTPLDVPISLILLSLPLSLWVSTNWWLSLPKVYGVILSVIFFYTAVAQITTRRDLAWATFWLVIVCIAISLAGLIGTDWAQNKIISAGYIYDRLPHFIQGIPRSIAGGFARNGVGGTLTLIVPLLGALVLARDNQAARLPGSRLWTGAILLSLVLAVAALALTQSRGAILGTAVGLVGLAIWRDRRFTWIVAAGVVGLAAVIALGQGGTLLDFLLRMDAQSGTLASRLEVWQRGIWMVQDFPFTGIGIGTYNTVAHALYPFFIAAPDELVAHSHNNLLQVAVDVGIPGMIAFVALLTGFTIVLVRTYRGTDDAGVQALTVGLGCGMLAHQTFGLTDAFMLGTKPGVLLWVFVALAVISYQQTMQQVDR